MSLSAFLLTALISSPAHATELTWEGYYRARGLLYNSLSLSDTNAQAEGTSNSFDHRLLLQPTWRISSDTAVHAQLDVLSLTTWGQNADVYVDPVTGESIATASADGVGVASNNLNALRAWGEASFHLGNVPLRLAMGRMPLQWGAGILWNSGDAIDGEYGDTADRLELSTRFGPVFMVAGWNVGFEGFLGVPDDLQTATLGIGYRNERAGVGLLSAYRYQPSLGFQSYTGDLWGAAALGPVDVELEMTGVFGGGDLDTGANDISLSAFGLMAHGKYNGEKLGFGGEIGVATGDADPNDQSIKTFSFDRDHNIALMLFEEPLPTLESTVVNDTNGGRTTEAALTGDGISNAVYFRPAVSYKLKPELQVELAWIGALEAKAATDSNRGNSYGNEFDLSLRYDPIPHVFGIGTAGVLLPGGYYREYTDEELGSGFDKPAIGLRFMGGIEF